MQELCQNHCRRMLASAISAVQPEHLLSTILRIEQKSRLHLRDILLVDLNDYRRTYLIGFGKAVFGLAKGLDSAIGRWISRGLLSVPTGTTYDITGFQCKNIEVLPGAYQNLPDTAAMNSATAIQNLTASLEQTDLLFILMSGGGSALFPLPEPPLTLDQYRDLIRALSRNGATISELNAVRRRIDVLKGGGLARVAFPARVISLILSDYVGDPLEVLASGPTTPDPTTQRDVRRILAQKLGDHYPNRGLIEEILNRQSDTCPENDSQIFSKVSNVIVGNNTTALEAAGNTAKDLGWRPVILSDRVEGDVRKIARDYAQLISDTCASLNANNQGIDHDYFYCLSDQYPSLHITTSATTCSNLHSKVSTSLQNMDANSVLCLIAGGEPTVEVNGTGIGGRNQELVLHVVRLIDQHSALLKDWNVTFLSAGTDGQDGSSDAAGAIGYLSMANDAKDLGLDIEHFLRNNDSATFFEQFEGGRLQVVCGPTGTNVMDIHVIVISRK